MAKTKLGITLIECPECHSRIDRDLVPPPKAIILAIASGKRPTAADPELRCPVCNHEAANSLWKEHKV